MTDPDLRPRRGAHRAPRRPLATLAPLVGALVILAVVVALGWNLRSDDDPATTTAEGAATPGPSGPPSAVESPSPPPPTTPTAPTAPTDTASPGADGAVGPAREQFEVVVLNQTRRAGFARSVAETLRADGWNVAATGNFGGTVPETTVYFPVAGEAAAAELAGRLPVPPRVLPVFPAIDGERLTVILTDNMPTAP